MRVPGRIASEAAVFLIVAIPAVGFSYRFFGANDYAVTFAVTLTGLIFFLVRQVARPPTTYVTSRVGVDRIVVALAVFSTIGSVLTISLRGTVPYYSLFNAISPLAYVEYLFAISLTEFLPGVLLLFALNAGRKLGFLGMVIFSYILSFFMCSCLASILLVGGMGLSQSYIYLGAINIVLSAVALLRSRTLKAQSWELRLDDGVLAFGFLLAFVGGLYYFADWVGNIPFLKEDLLAQFGNSIRYLQPGWQFSLAHLSYPPWFFWNLTVLLNQSSFPLVNAAVATTPLNLLLVVAIAYTAKVITKDRSIMILAATSFTLFGSSVYVLSALHVPNLAIRALPGFTIPFETWDFKDYMVGVVCTIPLVGLVYQRNGLEWRTRCLLIITSLDSAYLAHILEPAFFIAVALPVYLLIPGSDMRAKSVAALSVLAALGLAFLLGLFARISVIATAAEYLSAFTALLLVIAFGVHATLTRARLGTRIVQFLQRMRSGGLRPAMYVLVYLYGLSVVAFVILPAINMNLANWFYGIVPLGEFWVVLGLTAPSVLLGLVLVARSRTAFPSWTVFVSGFALLCVVAMLVIGFANTHTLLKIGSGSGNFVGVPTGLLAFRVFIVLFIPLSLLFGFVALRVAALVQRRMGGRYIMTLLMVGVIILGIPSTIQEARYYAGDSGEIGKEYTTAELKTMSFMAHQIPLNASVLALTRRGSLLLTATGKFNQPLDNFSSTIIEPFILSSRDPSLVLELLSRYQIGYIFVDQEDRGPLSAYKGGFLISDMLRLLPVAFNDSNNVVYSVPAVFPSSIGGGPELVSTIAATDDYATISALMGLTTAYSSTPYGIIPQSSAVAVFPYDPQPTIDASDYALFSVGPSSGDKLFETSQYVAWSPDLSTPGLHNLTVSLQPNGLPSDAKSLSVTMETTSPFLPCYLDVTAKGKLHQLQTFFSANETVSAAVPTAITDSLQALVLSCGTFDTEVSNATIFITAVNLGTYEDSSEQAISGLYPQQGNLSNYIRWVTNGGRLLVLDPGLPFGFFGHYLSLSEGASANLSAISGGGASRIPINSTSGRAMGLASGTTTLMSYETRGEEGGGPTIPLLIERRVGDGTLYWAQIGPLLSLMDDHRISLSQAASVFQLVLTAISPESRAVGAPAFDAILGGNATLAGQSVVSGAELTPLFGDDGFSVSGAPAGPGANYIIGWVESSQMSWRATSAYAEITPTPTPGVLQVTYPRGATFILSPSPGNPVEMGVYADGASVNFTVHAPVVLTTTAKVSLLASSPTISLVGVLNSSEILVTPRFYSTIDQPPYGYALEHPYTPFTSRGNMTMTGVAFGDAFIVKFGGKWQPVDPNPSSSWQVTPSDWARLFQSPLNWVLILVVGVLAALDLIVLPPREKTDGGPKD